jgi:hypothetical protein
LGAPALDTELQTGSSLVVEPGHAAGSRSATGVDILAALFCMAIGLFLSTLPHLLAWARTGDPVWIADFDDFSVYLPLAAHAYDNQPTRLDDPVGPDAGRSYYSSLQLAPGILLARALGLGPLGINIAWRALGGLALGLLWYLLVRLFVSRPLYAAGLAVLLVGDGGVLFGQLLYSHGKNMMTAANLAPDQQLTGPPNLLPQWRVVNPSLSWPWFLLFVWLLARARQKPSPLRLALAALAFGLLFYVYFYFWTAVGLSLLLALGLDRGAWKQYLTVGTIGLLIGAPALWINVQYREALGNDWMLRCDKFLPIGHFAELLIPRVTVAMLIVTLIWVWWWRRDLIFLWCLATAGLLLLNQQLVTGLQIENFHWNYVLGPSLALLSVLLIAGWFRRRYLWPLPVRAVFWAVLCLHLLGSVWMRTVEATRFREPLQIREAVRLYQDQRSLNSSLPRAANAVVGGDRFFVDSAMILEDWRPLSGYSVDVSAAVSTPEWDLRVALNSYLLGWDRTRFEKEQITWLDETLWGPWRRDRSPAARQERLNGRLTAWDSVVSNPDAALTKFQVRYLALPSGVSADHLGARWLLQEDGTTWQVWERRP